MLGREMPVLPKKVAELPPRERHEAARDAMMETVIHDADATLEFIQWVDGVTPDMTREEVFTRLKEQMDNLLRDVPKELEEIIAKLLKNSEESLKVEHALISISDNATNGDADAYEAACDELFFEDLELRAAMRAFQDAEFAWAIQYWAWDMERAWDDVHALQGDPEKARAAINELLSRRRDPVVLGADDVEDVYFAPFCVQFVLRHEAFLAVHGDGQDAAGFYFPNSNFACIDEKFARQGGAQETMAHEYGHRLLDHAPSHGRGNLTWRLHDSRQSRTVKERKEWNEALVQDVGAAALDKLHNEFLAEMNALRTMPLEETRNHHWSTAENNARNFAGEVETFCAAHPKERKLIERLRALAKNMLPRFERAKRSVIQALVIASALPEDTQARDFVAAAMFVLPVRSYHHLPEVMKKKYGEETVEKIEHAELMAALANLTNGEETPDFASLDAVMRSLRAHGAAVDWPESLWPFDVLDYWEVETLAQLQDVLARMRQWPIVARVHSEYDMPVEMAASFFGVFVDKIWRGGVAALPWPPEAIANDQVLRQGFLRALEITFDERTYDENFSYYLNIRGRGPRRAEVLASPMAEFVRAAGMEKEFVVMVDSVLPA